jgi:hypothetical protein
MSFSPPAGGKALSFPSPETLYNMHSQILGHEKQIYINPSVSQKLAWSSVEKVRSVLIKSSGAIS